MKIILFFLFLCILCLKAEAQTNIAGPENVLVVFNNTYTISQQIANYYKDIRSIPNENMFGINNLPTSIRIDNHLIELIDYYEVIVDRNGNTDNDKSSIYNQTMKYVKQYITQPIEDYLNSTIINGETLANRIRYIVMCKGVPFKATSWLGDYSFAGDGSRRCVSIDALVSIINQSDPNFSITNSSFISSGSLNANYSNPYFNMETLNGSNYNFDYRFKTKTYINPSGIELNYMVSRLDGYDKDDVISMIYRGLNSDKSGESIFVLDGDEHPYEGTVLQCTYDVHDANQNLNNLNFLTDENESDLVIINTNGNAMGYESAGLHSDPILSYNYCNNVLQFNYSFGALFNTYESFNGYVFDINNLGENTPESYGKRQGPGQGLIADFIHAGGSGGESHVYEPTVFTLSNSRYSFPAYAMGYSLVEAIYMGIPYLAYRNLVVGDPLTTIAWGKQTLTANTTLSETNLVTGQITVSAGKTLTIASNAVINFKYQGALKIDGTLHTKI